MEDMACGRRGAARWHGRSTEDNKAFMQDTGKPCDLSLQGHRKKEFQLSEKTEVTNTE